MKTISNRKTGIHRELWLFALLIILLNLPLLIGSPWGALLFVPARIVAGEWWRIFTGFFVHVSWYHLLLDAGAFLMLIDTLRDMPRARRLLLVGACGLGSLVLSLPSIGLHGTLCGLSGIAHGLLAILALQMAGSKDRNMRRAAFVCFIIVLMKCIFEAATGHVLFENLHFGSVANPVAVCHAGGVLGGVLMYALLLQKGDGVRRQKRFGKAMLSLFVIALCSMLLLGCWYTRSMREARFLTVGRPARETVVLVHGLNRTGRAMKKMAAALRADNYTVIICDYPSRSANIETLSADLFNVLRPQLAAAKKVHFVTHSMGGLLVRDYLQKHSLPNLGRVVMLGPPNGGSEVVDRLGSLSLYHWINGPAGTQLGTLSTSFAFTLKPSAFYPGVIAGDRTINPILSLMIPGKDDGKVAVRRTKTESMGDFLCLHTTHACMMRNRKVINQTRHYLKHGCFNKTNYHTTY